MPRDQSFSAFPANALKRETDSRARKRLFAGESYYHAITRRRVRQTSLDVILMVY